MIINKEETMESYETTISEKYYRFLEDRKVISKEYFSALRSGQFGILCENVLIIQGKPYCLNCILGQSDESIYDIIETNKLYGLSKDDGTVFAVLYGDDYLYFKPNDSKVYYKSLSSDEDFLVSNSYKEFLSKIDYQEEH